MPMIGRPPLTTEINRQRGTYRKDRHGPKPMLGPVEPDVLWRVEPGSHPFICSDCGQPWLIELLDDRTWRQVHEGDCNE
jgi:hypothetical protein